MSLVFTDHETGERLKLDRDRHGTVRVETDAGTLFLSGRMARWLMICGLPDLLGGPPPDEPSVGELAAALAEVMVP